MSKKNKNYRHRSKTSKHERVNEILYIEHKNFHTKTQRVHSTGCTQCIHNSVNTCRSVQPADKAAEHHSEFRSGLPVLMSRMVSVDVKQH